MTHVALMALLVYLLECQEVIYLVYLALFSHVGDFKNKIPFF